MKTYLPSLIFLFIAIGALLAIALFDISKGLVTFIATISGVFISLALFASVGKYLHKKHQAHMEEIQEANLREYFKDK